MTTSCSHGSVTWLNRVAGWTEKDIGSSGAWWCNICRSEIKDLFGSGYCRSCNRPIDDHELVNHSTPHCKRRSA